jgi:uncharacterized membrane protein
MKKLILGIGAAATLFSCGAPEPTADAGSDAGSTDPDLTCAASPAAATLATNVQAVFDAKCKTCHVANYYYGGYSTAAETATIVSKKSLYAGASATLLVVDPRSLANSALWLKVLGGASASRSGPKGENVVGKMPNDTTTLTAAEQQLLKDWICGGAK